MHSKHKVILNTDEQAELKLITTQGKHSVRKIKRAQTLLMSHIQVYRDEDIAESLSLSLSTVYRTKRYFVEYGLEEALNDEYNDPRNLDHAKRKI